MVDLIRRSQLKSFSSYIIMFTSIIVYALDSSVARADSDVDVSAEAMVGWVNEWVDGFASFDGRVNYEIHRYKQGQEPYESYAFDYRFRGDDVWFGTYDLFGEGDQYHQEGILRGRCAYRLDRRLEGEDIDGEVVINVSDGWRWPTDFAFPGFLYRRPYASKDLKTLLSEGRNFAIRRNGQYVLSHWAVDDIDSSVDIYFNENRLVTRMEWVSRWGIESPTRFESDYAKNIGEFGDVYSMWLPRMTIEYLNYIDFSGVEIATEYRSLGFSLQDEPRIAEAQRQLAANEIDFSDYIALSMKAKESIPITTERYLRMDVASAVVNSPLADDAFKIRYGAKAMVYDSATSEFYRVKTWSELLLLPSVFLGLALGISGVGYYRYSTRRRIAG
ncbi:MAG: hypothetical protein GC168_07950 [Candidatus Hydrogenedens sp.]|nr:hypothetical protein [Candidatus Hydrogenedens sp.]